MGLLDSSRLCWRHFDEEDIIKGKFYPQQLWRLRDGATPKHLLDPGSSQVTTFDDSLLDSALVPITSALPDPGSSQVMFGDDFPIDSSLGPDDLIDTGSDQEPLGDVSPIYSPLLPDIDVPKAQRAREDKYRRSEFSLGKSASDLGLSALGSGIELELALLVRLAPLRARDRRCI
ncbi:hypothetical protein OUZ56_003612 [Daphnia magna]|uniref:THAP-type domain-containing protein n=1 Tax=Daphnia magna TaxID=35525 RepID=A0ABR0A995_9CRUS|nr:hypothetical protein OUZ56_003612 [Daphnia magna]